VLWHYGSVAHCDLGSAVVRVYRLLSIRPCDAVSSSAQWRRVQICVVAKRLPLPHATKKRILGSPLLLSSICCSQSTGSVDSDTVYTQGRYGIGADKKFLKYQSDAHHIVLDNFSVFSAGGGNESIGLEFKIDVDFTFMLKKDEIGQLHRELASSYKDIIVSRAKDAIKNGAANVSFTEYFQGRKTVEARFREAVQSRWDTKPPLHCTLDQFHLGSIQIPDAVAEKQLQSRVQNERNEMEASLQQATIQREMTAVDVNTILLQKEKVLRTADAEANLLRANARAEAARIVQEAQINGTQLLFEAAGITNQEHMTAFTYIRTLMNRENVELDISYLSADNVLRTTTVV
jgi:SPFH domain / Band 7 family